MELTLSEYAKTGCDAIEYERACVEKNMHPLIFRNRMLEELDYVRFRVGAGYQYLIVKNEKYEYLIRDVVDLKALWRKIIEATKSRGSLKDKVTQNLTPNLSNGLSQSTQDLETV